MSQRWPKGSRLVQLRDGQKVPYAGPSGNAHLGAVVDEAFIQVGQNVGIVLEGMYLLADIDQPHDPIAQRWIASLTGTWQQATPRQHATSETREANPTGTHFLLRVPPGWTGHNKKILGANGKPVGDVKARGFLVAPGSAIVCDDGVTRPYVLVNGCDPLPAPPWLLEFSGAEQSAAGEDGLRDGIPAGEHDDYLTAVGYYLRRKHRLSEKGLRVAIKNASASLQDVDPTRPYTELDFARIARSSAKVAPDTRYDAGPLQPENWLSGSDVELVRAPVEWWIRGFVPKGELVMLYGAGGKGKSSWGSWLAAEVTKRNGSFAFFGVEEPFTRFLWRAILAGGDRQRIYSPSDATRMRFPRDADMLRQAIIMSQTDVIYIDSIMSHFEHLPGLNTAERARLCLGPLANIAQTTGTTIICVFHERRAGDFMGSAEMENVGRYMLHASRGKTGPLTIRVQKTNLFDPGVKLAYSAPMQVATDPLSGHTQMERLDDGTLVPFSITVPQRIADVPVDEDPEQIMPEELDADTQEMTLFQPVWSYITLTPGASASQVAKAVGCSKSHAHRIMTEGR